MQNYVCMCASEAAANETMAVTTEEICSEYFLLNLRNQIRELLYQHISGISAASIVLER